LNIKISSSGDSTAKYDIEKLVYYEIYDDPENAILREKRLKGSSRARKNKLVEAFNPEWFDLYDQIQDTRERITDCFAALAMTALG